MFIHKTAEVSKKATIGKDTKIWNNAHIREGAKIGENCVLSRNVYIDHHVVIGHNVKIQNNSSIYYKAILENGVFIGPHVCFTNDKIPRAVTQDEKLKEIHDWSPQTIHIKEGASLGANSTILSGVTIGKWALIGAGAVVTKDVPDYGLVTGCPARLIGHVCKCGDKIQDKVCKKCNIGVLTISRASSDV